jgi:hypothetical protein
VVAGPPVRPVPARPVAKSPPRRSRWP